MALIGGATFFGVAAYAALTVAMRTGDATAPRYARISGLGSVDEISGAKRKQNLTEHAGNARLSLELVTLKCDAPLPEPAPASPACTTSR